MKAQFSAGIFLLLAPCLAYGQAQQAPKPGPGVQKLAYYIGSWQGHGETKGGPFGAAGKLSSKQTCTWFSGGFQVICRGEETGPTGTRSFLNILSYDEKAKSYTEYAVSSLGDAEYDQGGTFAGNKLTYIVDQDVAGKPVKFRYSEVRVSPVLFTYQAEASISGGPWKALATGEIRKLK